MKQPWEGIVWWEVRRLPFNLALLAAGILSLVAVGFLGSGVFGDADFGNPFLEVAEYAIAANLFYTFGWITEVIWGETAHAALRRPKVFRRGLIFSVGLTLLPGIVVLLIWVGRVLL